MFLCDYMLCSEMRFLYIMIRLLREMKTGNPMEQFIQTKTMKYLRYYMSSFEWYESNSYLLSKNDHDCSESEESNGMFLSNNIILCLAFYIC